MTDNEYLDKADFTQLRPNSKKTKTAPTFGFMLKTWHSLLM
jgi:hypothetical protein